MIFVQDRFPPPEPGRRKVEESYATLRITGINGNGYGPQHLAMTHFTIQPTLLSISTPPQMGVFRVRSIIHSAIC
jgi:hypothetical protein